MMCLIFVWESPKHTSPGSSCIFSFQKNSMHKLVILHQVWMKNVFTWVINLCSIQHVAEECTIYIKLHLELQVTSAKYSCDVPHYLFIKYVLKNVKVSFSSVTCTDTVKAQFIRHTCSIAWEEKQRISQSHDSNLMHLGNLTWWTRLAAFQRQHQCGEKNPEDLYDFECDMIVGARRAGLGIWGIADLLVFSCTRG